MTNILQKLKGNDNPTIRVEKRFSALRLVLAVLIALLIAFLLMCTISDNPLRDLQTLLIGPLAKKSRRISIISKLIPLLFTGTAVCLINSAGQITTACEGAFYFGAVAATAVAIIPGIPSPVHIPLCFIAGAFVGAIIVMIPTWFNVRYNVLTIVVALLVTNVFVYFGQYLILHPLKDTNPNNQADVSKLFEKSALLPNLAAFGYKRIHLGLLIGIIIVLFGYFMLYKTPFGFEIRSVGMNQRFSRYSGINVGRTAIITALISGSIAGMGGTSEVLGLYERFMYTGTTNHGWNGIVIAVLCKNNPKFVPVAALFLAYLSTAADALNSTSKIPPEIINIIQPIIIIFVAAARLLAPWEHRAIVKASQRMIDKEN